jgi:hypothetical protein
MFYRNCDPNTRSVIVGHPISLLSKRVGKVDRAVDFCRDKAEIEHCLRWSDIDLVIDFIGEPGGARTRDPLIKSQVLYQLSYGLWGGRGQ